MSVGSHRGYPAPSSLGRRPISYGFAFPVADSHRSWAPGLTVIRLRISVDTNNYNMFVAAGSPTYPCLVICAIDPGVIVGSTSTGTYAFDTGTGWHEQTRLVLFRHGKINGKGGAGGVGGIGVGNGTAGSAGGNALNAQKFITIFGDGFVRAGGGGGGGGGGHTTGGKAPVDTQGGGGGGGRGTTDTAGGAVGGGTGSDLAAGAGGTNAPAGAGGAGGDFGVSGTAGAASSGTGGAGGAAGNAVNGESKIEWRGSLDTVIGARVG